MVAELRPEFELRSYRSRSSGPMASAWLQQHAQSFVFSLGQLIRSPGTTALTVLIIAVALAVPCGFFSLLHNASQLASRWEGGGQLSIFLAASTSLADAEARGRRMRQWVEIDTTRVINPADALREFETKAGISGVQLLLDGHNPLPPVISARIAQGIDEEQMAEVIRRVNEWDGVDSVELDRAWLQRLKAIIRLVERAVWVVGVLMFLGVLLTVGNTIRAGIAMRREEIEIALLFGATPAFVRRPFLYAGVAIGLTGALLAWLIVIGGLALLADPIRELSAMYASTYSLSIPGFSEVSVVLAVGAVLGGGGSILAVGRHLKSISPG